MKALLPTAALAAAGLFAFASAANAGPITITGNFNVTSTCTGRHCAAAPLSAGDFGGSTSGGTTKNRVLAGNLGNLSLDLNTPVTETLFNIKSDWDSYSASDVSAIFSSLSDGTSASGTYSFTGTLGRGATSLSLTPASYNITFDDGAVLEIALSDWRSHTIPEDATFTLLDGPTPPSLPEPGSLALLGAGLCGLGLAWRRRRS